jgi:DNA-binding NtrC family response regulator
MADPRVLLVDDQRQVTRMLRTSLELSGRQFDIVDVTSAEEGLREMERGPVDLVVTDLRLPEMSGLELIARIRQTHPGMRAILVTGQPTRQVEAQARALGVVAFIPKPVSTTLFLQAVDRALVEEQTGLPEPEIVGETARAAERLMTMQRELGAGLVILATLQERGPAAPETMTVKPSRGLWPTPWRLWPPAFEPAARRETNARRTSSTLMAPLTTST